MRILWVRRPRKATQAPVCPHDGQDDVSGGFHPLIKKNPLTPHSRRYFILGMMVEYCCCRSKDENVLGHLYDMEPLDDLLRFYFLTQTWVTLSKLQYQSCSSHVVQGKFTTPFSIRDLIQETLLLSSDTNLDSISLRLIVACAGIPLSCLRKIRWEHHRRVQVVRLLPFHSLLTLIQ